MTVTNDDRPHPIPAVAYLRYKENWFFLIFDKDNDVFGAVHVSTEPIFDRVVFACHLRVQGELFQHGGQISIPDDFAFADQLSDGVLTLRFVQAHEKTEIALHNDDMAFDISFLARGPLFNFDDYDSANPDKASLREVMTIASNQQTHHQQQGMLTRGTIVMKSGQAAGTTFTVDALGYRDHSRSIRSDNLVLKHIWTGMHFSKHIFGVMTVTSALRPESPTYSGYVYDEDGGLRPLSNIEFEGSGKGPDAQPAKLELRLTDIHSEEFIIVGHLKERYSSVPLQSEKPGPTPYVYSIVENFVPLTLEQAGDTGIGLIEIGRRVSKD